MIDAFDLPLGREWIASRIPHSGAMCLLDAVTVFDSERIVCLASSHRSLDNPLRFGGRLGAVCGVEYAAQAMAVHGVGFVADADASSVPPVGMLVNVRGVRCFVERLDTLVEELSVEALRLGGDEGTVLYRFFLRAGGLVVVEGRAVVLLGA